MHLESTTRASSRAMSPAPQPITPKDGHVILDGFGIRMTVERGHLVLADGVGDTRRAGTFHKATCRLKRLAIIGHTGAISLDALRWLADVGASLTIIDPDGTLLLAHGPRGLDDGRLRRAQAIAPYTGAHLAIIRFLLAHKLAGQAANLESHGKDPLAARAIRGYADALAQADSVEASRAAEANAALAYWDALADTPITFGKRDHVPDHWRTFGGRASALTGNPRRATNPINAMLNYAYAILEAEASIACRGMGLDPALGVLHADTPNRDSLACDVMEAVRPAVDAFILDLLATRTFGATSFHQTREGVCRVLPPLTHMLTATSRQWAKLLGPHVEQVAQAFMDSRLPSITTIEEAARYPRAVSLPTKLSERHRRDSREGRNPRPRAACGPLFPSTCRACGLPLPDRGRQYCEGCGRERQAEVLAAFTANGPKALAGSNHGGETGIKRGRANAAHQEAIKAWERAHPEDVNPDDFTTRILPRVQGLPLRRVVDATGLSLRYCSLVRRGERVPHPMHWAAFARAGKDAQDMNARAWTRVSRGHGAQLSPRLGRVDRR